MPCGLQTDDMNLSRRPSITRQLRASAPIAADSLPVARAGITTPHVATMPTAPAAMSPARNFGSQQSLRPALRSPISASAYEQITSSLHSIRVSAAHLSTRLRILFPAYARCSKSQPTCGTMAICGSSATPGTGARHGAAARTSRRQHRTRKDWDVGAVNPGQPLSSDRTTTRSLATAHRPACRDPGAGFRQPLRQLRWDRAMFHEFFNREVTGRRTAHPRPRLEQQWYPCAFRNKSGVMNSR